MKTCNKCDTELILGDNWKEGSKKYNVYKCTSCQKLYNKKWQQNNPNQVAKHNTKSYNKYKPNDYVVYLLTKENYVGVSGYMKNRIKNHKHGFNRDTNYKILHRFSNRKDALAKEKEYHAMGYNG